MRGKRGSIGRSQVARAGPAAEILKMLDRGKLSVRGAQARTGIAAADFSRIRNADLGRFTLDRLVSTINRLGARVEVQVKVRASLPVEEDCCGEPISGFAGGR